MQSFLKEMWPWLAPVYVMLIAIPLTTLLPGVEATMRDLFPFIMISGVALIGILMMIAAANQLDPH